MSVPILLVVGFLGSGKTTLINGLLQGDHGKRISAIVNDFGAINIDEALLENATDEVIGLKNGCICCALQGDLLRTLKQVLSGIAPDLIVIEASGIADPQGIINAVLDPVLWPAVLLDTVVCLVDAQDLIATPERASDPLWQAQVRAADIIQLSKADEISAQDLQVLSFRINAMGKSNIFHSDTASLIELTGMGSSNERRLSRAIIESQSRFASLSWRCDKAVPMSAFQHAIGELSPLLMRAKGFVSFIEKPDVQLVFQLVGQRAVLAPRTEPGEGCELVLIGEKDRFDPDAARLVLDTILL